MAYKDCKFSSEWYIMKGTLLEDQLPSRLYFFLSRDFPEIQHLGPGHYSLQQLFVLSVSI